MTEATTVFQLIREGMVSAALALGSWVIMFPLRSIVKAVKSEWRSKTKLLEEVHTELQVQRTNCLTTLQNQGERQVELLEKAVNTLDAIHTSQAEMSGYLKGRQG